MTECDKYTVVFSQETHKSEGNVPMTRKHIGLMLVIILVAITSGLVLTRGQTIDSTATVTRGSADLTESQVTEHITRLDGAAHVPL